MYVYVCISYSTNFFVLVYKNDIISYTYSLHLALFYNTNSMKMPANQVIYPWAPNCP